MSQLEDLLEFQLKAAKIKYEREYRFHPTRRWRFDFAWPDRKLAAEIDGGNWTAGRHVRGLGYQQGCDKNNAAVSESWRIFHFTGVHIKSGEALKIIEAALK